MEITSENNFIEAMFDLLTEAFEGGKPSKGTHFLVNTTADGTGNQGLLPILEGLSAVQASDPTALGVSVATNEWDWMTVFASVTYHLGLITQTAKLAREF